VRSVAPHFGHGNLVSAGSRYASPTRTAPQILHLMFLLAAIDARASCPRTFWIARERLWRSRNLRNPLVDEPHELSSLGGNTLIRVPLVRLAKLSQGVLMTTTFSFRRGFAYALRPTE
jgi:hypothetical protein